MNNDTIEWKDIPGYEGLYQVSNTGQVKSLRRQSKILKPDLAGGYLRVTLSAKGVKQRYPVHRLVMLAFVGNADRLCVNHRNGIRIDNHLENLEYCTQSENVLHAINVLKTSQFGKNHWAAKLNEETVRDIRTSFSDGVSRGELARKYNVTLALICMVIKRKIWKQVE